MSNDTLPAEFSPVVDDIELSADMAGEPSREAIARTLDALVGDGLLEVVPTCQVSLPPSFAALLTGVEWKPWDGDPLALQLYRMTKEGRRRYGR
jgi:hypothetical protein